MVVERLCIWLCTIDVDSFGTFVPWLKHRVKVERANQDCCRSYCYHGALSIDPFGRQRTGLKRFFMSEVAGI